VLAPSKTGLALSEVEGLTRNRKRYNILNMNKLKRPLYILSG